MSGERTRRRVVCLLLFGWLGAPSPGLRAQAIVAPSARTLFNRATLVRSFAQVDRFSLRTDGGSKDITQYVTPIAVAYGFYPKWMVIVAQPYLTVDTSSRTGNESRRENVNGLADTQLFLQYDGLYSRNAPGGLTRLSGVFGLQAPTGARRFSTRAVEYTGGLVFQKQTRLRYVLTADFEYTFATENRRGLSVGDRARFDVVPGYFLISQGNDPGASWLRRFYDRAFGNGAYFIVEFNGGWQDKSRIRGAQIANTGGTTLSISPGIQLFPSRSLVLEFSSPLPVVKELNGTQPEPRPSFVFGFRYLF